jgi:hypothetical protein
MLAGHRLAVSGTLAAVADPEGAGADGRAPAVHFVDTSTSTVRHVALPDGARPGAIELMGTTAWVVLEGSHGVASIDSQTGSVARFYPTCPAPADLALDGADVWVACASGEVVKVSNGAMSTVHVAGVPARIAVAQGKVWVAFADATLARVDLTGVLHQARPQAPFFSAQPLSANTSRRLVVKPGGGLVMLHQQSVEGELDVGGDPGSAGPLPVDSEGADGGSEYSGSGACPMPASSGAVSESDGDGNFTPGQTLPTTLALDEAVSPQGVQAVADPSAGQVVLLTGGETPIGIDCANGGSDAAPLLMPGASSVAFGSDGKLLVLKAGATLSLARVDITTRTTLTEVSLRSRTVPAGFMLFHASPRPDQPTVPNVACASCHPAGLNNGATLTIDGVKHKVMTVGGHLSGMQNVHWDNQSFQAAVIDGTWQKNMGGRALTATEGQSLAAFVSQLQLPSPPTGDAVQVAGGRAAFDKAGCATCHSPSTHYTNNLQADVGRGLHRVPSLVGLAYSAPYMSDGCAKTLEQRFDDPMCGGGTQHGHVEVLSPVEHAALIAFLKTL